MPAKKVSVAVTVATKQRESTRSTLEKGVGFKKTSSGTCVCVHVGGVGGVTVWVCAYLHSWVQC